MYSERPTPEELKPPEKKSMERLLHNIATLAERGEVDASTGEAFNEESFREENGTVVKVGAFRFGRMQDEYAGDEPLPIASILLGEEEREGKEMSIQYKLFGDGKIEKVLYTFDIEEQIKEIRRFMQMSEDERHAFVRQRSDQRRAGRDEERKLGLLAMSEKELGELNGRLETFLAQEEHP